MPPPKDKVYTEMEALIQHFLVHSQGFIVPAGEAYVPVEGPRGEHGCYVVSDGSNRPWRVKMRSPSLMACQALPKMIVGGLIADVICRHRIDRRRHGRRGPVSFHPEMRYESGLHVSQRELRREGEPFAFTPENRERLERIAAHYPPEHRRSAVIPALYIVQEQHGLRRRRRRSGTWPR